jgi:hypothetical protein
MVMTIIKEWLPLVIVGFNAAMFIVIKFNDMSHIDKRLQELIKRFDDVDKKLDKTSERLALTEGKCLANHG